jgi:hypothetical protein
VPMIINGNGMIKLVNEFHRSGQGFRHSLVSCS